MLIILLYIINIIFKKIDIKNSIEDRKVKNDLYRIYMDIDIIKTNEIIDNILNQYINRWVLVNITSKGDDYIKDSEVEELIKDVTTMFIANMSDVHLFYMNCLYRIPDDDTLVMVVREKVKFLVLDFIIEFNKTE
jgi:hypothetical protein